MSEPLNDSTRRHGRRDTIGLVIAVLFLIVAASGIGGATWWLVPHLLPWIAAGAAALVGLGLIVSSLPRRHD